MGISRVLISYLRWKKKSLALSLQWKKRSSVFSMSRGRKRQRRRRDYVKIPLDLQMEIMIRLPAKSLMRFKCVSKLWSSLISSRYLSNLYLTSYVSTPRLYISLVDNDHEFGSVEFCKNAEKSQLLSLSSSSSAIDKDWTIPGIGGHHMMAHRGLILYTLSRKACLYNPSTRQSLILPTFEAKINAQEEEILKLDYYFLGHDPVLDQYKVVYNGVICSKDHETIDARHWVFVVEAGGSWKGIEFDQPHLPTKPGICINGVIYYLASAYLTLHVIVTFDVRSEEFNMIQVPHAISEYVDFIGFIEYCEKPAIFDHTHLRTSGLVDLWVLEDDGIWSKKSLNLKPCQIHLVDNDIVVEGTTQKGEVMLVPITLGPSSCILYYDLQKNDLRKVDIRGLSDHHFPKSHVYYELIDKGESIIHLQT